MRKVQTELASEDKQKELQEAQSEYEATQYKLERVSATKLALRAAAVKKIKAELGANAEITPKRLKKYGYNEEEQTAAVNHATNKLLTAQRALVRAGGTPSTIDPVARDRIRQAVAANFNVSQEEMYNEPTIVPDREVKEEPVKESEDKEEQKEEQKSDSKPEAKKEKEKVQLPAEESKPQESTKAPPEKPQQKPINLPQGNDNKKKDSIWSGNNLTIASQYTKTYTSYSGHDMVAIFEIPLLKGTISQVVGELQTISYSMYNEKMPVRVLGDMNMKSVVFGNRTIAGSMVFTVFDRHWAHKMMDAYLAKVGSNAHILTDELPPINITISMSNEYGSKSRLALYGTTFVMEGQVMSVNDMYTENTFQFMAKDLDYLTNVVDKNAASKTRNPSEKKKRNSTASLPEDTTPVDKPEDNEPAAAPNQKKETKSVDYSFAFGKSEQDYSVGREAYMTSIDNIYKRLSTSIREDYNSGGFTRGEYVAHTAALQKAWKQAHIDADKYYNEKKEGA